MVILIIGGVVCLPLNKEIKAEDNYDVQIAAISQEIANLEKAMAPLKKESGDLQNKISTAKTQISKLELQMTDLAKKLLDKEADLEVQKILMSKRVRRYYVDSKKFSPLMLLFSTQGAGNLLKQFTWYQSVIAQDKNMISDFSQEIVSLNNNKANLESQKNKLAELRKNMESRFGFLAGEIQKAEANKKRLNAELTKLIEMKTAMFNTSVGNVSSSDDPASRADYNPGFSPAFAVFSFGAPHRKGMSQYGAFGRAKAGQNYETILKAYYGNIKIEKIEVGDSIKTAVGTLPFEENYLVGIAEMPAKWGEQGGFEALKAQAIAARTYALAYTNKLSGTICVTEACQVYSKNRLNNPGKWKEAVEQTRGLVIKSNNTGEIFSTMYASTSGGATIGYSSKGHSTPQLWDSSCGNQGCWPGEAFEKMAGSPWFYKGWYTLRDGRSFGLNHPWLNNDDFADIVNAVLYYSKTGDGNNLSQYRNCISGCVNAWSKDELRRQVADKGGPVSSITSVGVDYSTAGVTKNVRIGTDKGNFTFDANTFKTAFNLRAPGAIVIKSDLFNLEKK